MLEGPAGGCELFTDRYKSDEDCREKILQLTLERLRTRDLLAH